jgi:LPXTG-site transpeptidase (sortase) family protein
MTDPYNNFFGNWRQIAGTTLVGVSVLVLLGTFAPVIKEEAKYQLSPKRGEVIVVSSQDRALRERVAEGTMKQTILVPIDEDFGIVIPKIGANAKVIADVDWRDPVVYQRALAQGVAQARGTALPGELGNIFLFSHSGVDFFEANRYNALFYLINKLVAGDEIIIMYHGEKFTYQVMDKQTVAPESIEYLGGDMTKKTLTLMTCWPAGTTLKRLLVIAEQSTLR